MAPQKGDYLEYPCVNGCGHHMRVKDDLKQTSQSTKVTLECPTCSQEKEYSRTELKGIVNCEY